jgi:hypothetical protein
MNSLLENGFEEVLIEDGMSDSSQYSDACSGGRSDCCTRVCSADANFVNNSNAWEAFLDVAGGQIQY